MLLFLFIINVVLYVIVKENTFTYGKSERQLEEESRLMYLC